MKKRNRQQMKALYTKKIQKLLSKLFLKKLQMKKNIVVFMENFVKK